MLSCHKYLQAAGGGQQMEWQKQAVPTGSQEDSMGTRSSKQMKALNSSLKRERWGLPCLVPDLSVTSAGIWTPLVWMSFRIWHPLGLFWGGLVGRSGKGTVPVAHLLTCTGERLGLITGRIPWRYPATGQQEGQANLKGTVAPWTLSQTA